MYWTVARDFLLCIPATAFFAVLLRVPRKAIPVSAVLGGAGYALYELASPLLNSTIAGFFLGTLLMALCSEIFARILKMPATVFVIPAIIPLVPGIGLYNTMLYLVQGQNGKAAQTGTSTLLSIIAMAMALVITTIFAKVLTSAVRSIRKET